MSEQREGWGGVRRTCGLDAKIGARLRERRCKLGWTQQDLAEQLGITYQQSHKYERGLNRMSAVRLYQAARVLGVEFGWFFEGIDDVAAPEVPKHILEMMQIYEGLPRQLQDAVRALARALAEDEECGIPPRAAGAVAAGLGVGR